MITPRGGGHTATLLLDGSVLVAGGTSGEDLVTQAELFDPTRGTWIPAGQMIEPRYNHTATRLLDGRVLVAGGVESASAELFDPATGTWTATASMASQRSLATATLLQDGNVLVVGGASGCCHGGGLASAQLYDPSSASWSTTGSMSVGRYGHTATLLAGDIVLVAGGFVDEEVVPLNSGAATVTELYDPVSRAWSLTGPLTEGRGKHRAILLHDGSVLVTRPGNNGSAERYDVWTGTWSVTGNMRTPRSDHPATLLLDGTVLVAGGYGPDGGLASAELYNPIDGRWIATNDMIGARSGHTSTLLLNGSVLVAGGAVSHQGSPSALIFTP